MKQAQRQLLKRRPRLSNRKLQRKWREQITFAQDQILRWGVLQVPYSLNQMRVQVFGTRFTEIPSAGWFGAHETPSPDPKTEAGG